ncbi:MAG: hypothetical protein IJ733_18150 [Lachnospiraceae bacterium]|nr:hypothetical protein [Lachnospiraceae bacterium]
MKHKIFKRSILLLISFLLGIVCVFQMHLTSVFFSSAFTDTVRNASAKENQITKPHGQITEAYPVSMGKVYSDSIPAYGVSYYRLSVSDSVEIHDICFYLKAAAGSRLVPKLLGPAGNPLRFKRTGKAAELLLTLKSSQIKNAGRLFLEIKNQASVNAKLSLSCSVKKQTQEALKPKEDSKKPQKDTSKNDSSKRSPEKNTAKSDTSGKDAAKKENPEKNPSEKEASGTPTPNGKLPEKDSRTEETPTGSESPQQKPENGTLTLKPHFIRIEPKQKRKLTFSVRYENSGKKRLFKESDFIWLSTNEETASAEDGILHAKKEGIAILYIKHKTEPSLKDSVLVRVYPEKQL